MEKDTINKLKALEGSTTRGVGRLPYGRNQQKTLNQLEWHLKPCFIIFQHLYYFSILRVKFKGWAVNTVFSKIIPLIGTIDYRLTPAPTTRLSALLHWLTHHSNKSLPTHLSTTTTSLTTHFSTALTDLLVCYMNMVLLCDLGISIMQCRLYTSLIPHWLSTW